MDDESEDEPSLAASDAFGLLGNEIRMEIVRGLWEAHEDDDGRTFSELFEHVSTRDTGNFNYHLGRLVGHFVEETDGGYRLTQPGVAVARAVIAGNITDAPEFEPTVVDRTCLRCGAPVAISYRDDFLHVRCTACDGIFATRDGDASGTLLRTRFPPAGLADRTPEELFDAGRADITLTCLSLREGVCPVCTGSVTRNLATCTEHDVADGRCRTCGHRYPVVAVGRCDVCSLERVFPPGFCAYDHPAVVAALHDAGALDAARPWVTSDLPATWPVTALDDGRARVDVPLGDAGTLPVVIGPDLQVVDLELP